MNLLEPSRAGLSTAPLHRFKPACNQPCLMIPRLIDTSKQNTRRSTMKDSNRNIYFQSITHSAVDLQGRRDSGAAGRLAGPQQLGFSTSSRLKPENTSFLTERCSEKGCVFPAASSGCGMCVYHVHQQEEPVLFRSHQPTGMLLDPSRTLPTEKEYEGSRKRDRRRMAASWEQFQDDGTS